MFNLIPTKRHLPIALDLGTDSIKMLQMQISASGASIIACGRWRFPESAGSDPDSRREEVVAAVRNMLQNGNFKGRKVISALNCDQLRIKNIRLPQMPAHEIQEAVKWEARDRFDFDISSDYLEHLDAGPIRQGTEDREEIIMLASPPDVLAEHLDLLDRMGLRPEHIDAEPVALFRMFERLLRRKADDLTVSVILDVGLQSTRVVVAKGRRIVFIKSINIAGRNLNEAVAKQLNLSYSEAVELRIRNMREPFGEDIDSDNADEDPNSLGWTLQDAERSEIEALGREIALCLRYCQVTFRGMQPKKIVLTGGEAYDSALAILLNKHLNIEVVVGQPLQGINVSSVDFGSDRRGMLAEWAVCGGLAITDLDINDNSNMQEADYAESRFSA